MMLLKAIITVEVELGTYEVMHERRKLVEFLCVQQFSYDACYVVLRYKHAT